MADPLGEARRERELTKAALESSLDRMENRVRAELDWRSRLRRDGPRYAVIGVAAVGAVAAAAALSRLVRRGRRRQPGPAATTLEEVAEQLRELRQELDGRHGRRPAWQKLAVRAATAAGGAAGTYATRRMMDHFSGAAMGSDGEATRST